MFPLLGTKAKAQLKRQFDFWASLVTVLGVVVSASLYIIDRPTRKRDAVYTAWQVLASMEGKRGGGGRRSAIAQLRAYKEDLSGLNIDSAFLEGLNLSRSTLSDVTFSNAHLANAAFDGAHVSSAKCQNAQLQGARFTRSKLHTVDFSGAVITDADFQRAYMSRCIGGPPTTFNGSTFANATISCCQFSGANFDNCLFPDSQLVQVGLRGSQMRRSRIMRSVWRQVQGSSADLSLSMGEGVSIGGQSDLSSSRWDCAQLQSAAFEKVNLSGAGFFGADLTGAKFVDSDLRGADLSSATLVGVTIQKCTVEGLRLSGAKQKGLQMLNCIGQPVDLRVRDATE